MLAAVATGVWTGGWHIARDEPAYTAVGAGRHVEHLSSDEPPQARWSPERTRAARERRRDERRKTALRRRAAVEP